MSRAVPTALLSHLRGDTTTLASIWLVTKRNGTVIRGTDHDRDIKIVTGDFAGTYKSGGSNITGSDIVTNSDMSSDNLEVSGAFPETIAIPDITQDDIEAGLLSYARVQILMVNWASPDSGQLPTRVGFMGPLTYDSSGMYKCEIRGLSDLLTLNIGKAYGDKCDVLRFGDNRCLFDVASVTITATVSAITSRRAFTVTGITTQPQGYFNGGVLTGLTGNNTGFKRQIRIDNAADSTGSIQLFEPFPEDLELGDTFSMPPGCDRLLATCRDKFNNLVHFRGYGAFIPGTDALLSGPALNQDANTAQELIGG